MDNILITALKGLGVVSVVAIALILIAAANLEFTWKILAGAARLFALLFQSWRKRARRLTIEASVNGATKKFLGSQTHVINKAMRIRWVTAKQRAELTENDVIVCLTATTSSPSDLVLAASEYIRKGLLPSARPYVSPPIMEAIDLVVTRRVLHLSGSQPALDEFIGECLMPELERSPDLQDWLRAIDTFEKRGFLTRLYLPELHHMGLLKAGHLPDAETRGEGEKFTRFVDTIARKQADERVRLSFNANLFKVNVILFASRDTVDAVGIDAHDSRVTKSLNDGIEHIYFCGIGRVNAARAREIAARCASDGRANLVAEHHYRLLDDDDRPWPATIIHSVRSPTYTARPVEDGSSANEDFSEAIRICTPACGRAFEVRKVARLPGELTKVAVAPLRLGANAVGLAVGAEGANLHAVREVLGEPEERIEVIRWSDDPETLIRAALNPRDPAAVHRVTLLHDERKAVVLASSEDASRRLIGPGGTNVRLAAVLSGWGIHIGTPEHSRRAAAETPPVD